MLKFFWNGIKDTDNGGKLQRCFYSDSPLIGDYAPGTITIYGRGYYPGFSNGIREAFEVENNSEMMTDYFETDRIRVSPSHPLYGQVLTALRAKQARHGKGNA